MKVTMLVGAAVQSTVQRRWHWVGCLGCLLADQAPGGLKFTPVLVLHYHM